MKIILGENSIVIKVYDKNEATTLQCAGRPISERKVSVYLNALPLDVAESVTNDNGEAEFGGFLILHCDANPQNGEIYFQEGQIFIDEEKVYEGAILPEMSFYI